MMRVVMLGCGASVGVPSLSGGWGSCDPAEPRNRRRRCSILVETAGRRILVDTSPDLREQLLDAGVGAVDAVLFTHTHADHTHRSEAHTSELQSLMRISYAVFCL